MARRRSSSSVIAGRPVSTPDLSLTRVRSLSTVLREVEDRRTFHPMGRLRPPLSVLERSAARVIAPRGRGAVTSQSAPPSSLGFAVPVKVAICVRRKQRREVIFAIGAGGSRRVSKQRRRTEWSDVHC